MKAYQTASDGVVVPISCEKMPDTELDGCIIETVYESGGPNLLEALDKAKGQEVMEVMGNIAKIMAKLESKNIQFQY